MAFYKGREGRYSAENVYYRSLAGRDPLGKPIEIDKGLLDSYILGNPNAAALREANVFSAGDRPGYSPEAGITELYAGYYDWMQKEQKRLKNHEEYVSLVADQPGRRANILGGDQGLKSILGAGVV